MIKNEKKPCKMEELTVAWQRICDKCSPEKLTNLSPINPIYAHTTNKQIVNDPILEGLSLSVMLSEENQYINIISTVHQYHADSLKLSKVLQGIRSTIDNLKRIVDIYMIKEGTFGTVYEAIDSFSQTKVALKNIIPQNSNQYTNMLSMWKIFFERNILMSTNDCPFITRLIASFQDKSNASFWILMEFCYCDLGSFTLKLHGKIDLRQINQSHLSGENIMKKLHEKATKKLNYPYHDLIFIYLFEMLCALHFLADRHIVHCDLKPDNILIAANGHIKLTDLGAAQVYRLVNKRSALHIINDFKNMKKIVDDFNNEFKRAGNIIYLDPETTLRYLRNSDYQNYRELIVRNNLSRSQVNEEMTRQTFVTDLYSVGAIIIELLLGGVVVVHGYYYSSEILKKYGADEIDREHMNITLGFNAKVFVGLIYKRLTDEFSDDLRQIVKFISSLILQRSKRAKTLLRDIKVYRNYQVFIENAIDIKKVELLDYFWEKNIKMETVTNIILPKDLMNFCKGETLTENRKKYTISDLNIENNSVPLSLFNFQFRAPF